MLLSCDQSVAAADVVVEEVLVGERVKSVAGSSSIYVQYE